MKIKQTIKKIVKRNKYLKALALTLIRTYTLFLKYESKGLSLKTKLHIMKKYFIQEIKGLPRIIAFEPISTCPLNCEFCMLRDLRTFEKRRKVRMSFKEFKRIIDDTASFCTNIEFSGGEPILNNDIFKMLKYCHEKNITTVLATNAQLLNKEKIKQLLQSPPNHVLLALESPDRKTYEKIRHLGNFERLNKNIHELISQKKKTGQFYPLITLQMVLTKVNQYQEKYYHQIVSDLGADFSSVKAFGIWPEGSPEYFEKMEKEYIVDKKDNPISRHYLDNKGKVVYKKLKKGDCPLTQTAYIGSGGEVYPCWYILAQKFSPGNAVDNNFIDIWNSKTYKNFRKKMVEGAAYPGLCEKCIGLESRAVVKRVKK